MYMYMCAWLWYCVAKISKFDILNLGVAFSIYNYSTPVSKRSNQYLMTEIGHSNGPSYHANKGVYLELTIINVPQAKLRSTGTRGCMKLMIHWAPTGLKSSKNGRPLTGCSLSVASEVNMKGLIDESHCLHLISIVSVFYIGILP